MDLLPPGHLPGQLPAAHGAAGGDVCGRDPHLQHEGAISLVLLRPSEDFKIHASQPFRSPASTLFAALIVISLCGSAPQAKPETPVAKMVKQGAKFTSLTMVKDDLVAAGATNGDIYLWVRSACAPIAAPVAASLTGARLYC